ncbi:MAG: dUTP diphosphatase [Desulfovibrionaceae bacterium]|nr:dUTP diphosphatase [Desulfovibrionaceae bacterium]
MRMEDQGRIRVRVKFFRAAASLYRLDGPRRGTAEAAGFDLAADLENEKDIPPGERLLVPTGLAIEILEPGVAGFVYARSGLGGVNGLTVAQGVGVIDPDYRGEISVPLLNTSRTAQRVNPGQRIAQLIFQPFRQALFEPAEELGHTARGAGGFGHTGTI